MAEKKLASTITVSDEEQVVVLILALLRRVCYSPNWQKRIIKTIASYYGMVATDA